MHSGPEFEKLGQNSKNWPKVEDGQNILLSIHFIEQVFLHRIMYGFGIQMFWHCSIWAFKSLKNGMKIASLHFRLSFFQLKDIWDKQNFFVIEGSFLSSFYFS